MKNFLITTIIVVLLAFLLLKGHGKVKVAFRMFIPPKHISEAMQPLQQLLVSTKSGPVKGRLVVVPEKILVRAFLGIPYGQTTEGNNRFRKPRPVEAWSHVLDATRKKPPCVQESYISKAMVIDNANTTEDCLHLNIWTPIQNHSKQALKTVMLYFYGGSFMHGGNSYFFYDGRYIAGFGDVVVVVPNYRVGVLGFLNGGTADAPGNAGIHDQIMAVTWAKENIAAFGGDPDRMVLFGQSAGAISASYLQLSPKTRHLFKRAILQSCSALVPIPANSNEAAIENVQEIARASNCTRNLPTGAFSMTMTIHCLRSVDAKTLSSIKGAFFYPSFYDEVLPSTPYQMLHNLTSFGGHELLLGNTFREGDMMFEASFQQSLSSRSTLSIAAIIKAYSFFYKRSSFMQAILALARMNSLYDLSSKSYEGFRDAIGDVLFNCPTKYFASIFAAKKGKAFYYVLGHKPSFSVWNSPNATHTDDVSLLFGVPFMLPHLASQEERRLSRRLIGIWTTFAREGYVYLLISKSK